MYIHEPLLSNVMTIEFESEDVLMIDKCMLCKSILCSTTHWVTGSIFVYGLDLYYNCNSKKAIYGTLELELHHPYLL